MAHSALVGQFRMAEALGVRISNPDKARRQRTGLILLLLGSAVFLFFGFSLESATPKSMDDFKASYYGAKCLLRRSDPYDRNNLTLLYHAEEGQRSTDSVVYETIATTNVYLPSTLALMVPFAFLHYGPAHILWMVLIAASFLLASFLVWDVASEISPELSGCLVGFFIATNELLIFTGNSAGIAVGLAVVACWCFVRERFVLGGVVCLAISLGTKPHDSGLIWLFFLLAGGSYRRRALQTLGVVIALSLPMAIWVSHLSPHWMQELSSNLVPLSAHGGINDPGPASSGGHGVGMITDLQTVISAFWDNPRIYNTVSYVVCGLLLLVWMFATFRNRRSTSKAWIGLAAIAPLAMLPIYHRQYDAKLILLTVPACMIAWNKGGQVGRAALFINAVGFVIVGDLPSAILLNILRNLPVSNEGVSGRMLSMAQVFPVPLTLLTMGLFYLWLYTRWSSEPCTPAELPSTTMISLLARD